MRGRIPRRNEGTITWAVMCVAGAAASWPVDAADGVIVRIDTTCEAMAPDACLGAYGIRIAETGALGPIPGTRETVTVSLNEKTLVLKGDSGNIDKRCGEQAGHLAELFKAADAAMRRHYPVPFQ